MKFGCTGCKQYYHVNCFALLHRDGRLRTITDIPAHLAEDCGVGDFLNGSSKWNVMDQIHVGTEEDMVMAYNK